MDMNNSVNPSQSDPVRVQYSADSDNVVLNKEPPPPYTPEAVTNQPVNNQTVIVQAVLRATPTFYHCPECQARVLTRVEYINSHKTHMLAGFVCGFTFWCMLCCVGAIPYLVNTFKTANHYCPDCNTFLGAYSRL